MAISVSKGKSNELAFFVVQGRTENGPIGIPLVTIGFTVEEIRGRMAMAQERKRLMLEERGIEDGFYVMDLIGIYRDREEAIRKSNDGRRDY